MARFVITGNYTDEENNNMVIAPPLWLSGLSVFFFGEK